MGQRGDLATQIERCRVDHAQDTVGQCRIVQRDRLHRLRRCARFLQLGQQLDQQHLVARDLLALDRLRLAEEIAHVEGKPQLQALAELVLGLHLIRQQLQLVRTQLLYDRREFGQPQVLEIQLGNMYDVEQRREALVTRIVVGQCQAIALIGQLLDPVQQRSGELGVTQNLDDEALSRQVRHVMIEQEAIGHFEEAG